MSYLIRAATLPFWSEERDCQGVLALPSPPPYPTLPWSSTLPLMSPHNHFIVSSREPISPLPYCLVLRIRWDSELLGSGRGPTAAPSTYILASQSETPPLLLILLPTPSPPLPLPSTDHRTDRLEQTIDLLPCFGFEIGDDPRDLLVMEVTDTWDDMREADLSREAWGWRWMLMTPARFEVRALRTTVLAQQIEIAAL
ncbi:hypothetical protein Tco_0783504 [Tanacetum coccineum]